LPLLNGQARGILEIPQNLESKDYYLRCYTRWMMNFGPSAYAHVPLLIIHPDKEYIGPTRNGDAGQDEPQTTLDPESAGHWRVEGLKADYKRGDSIRFAVMHTREGGHRPSGSITLAVTRQGTAFPQIAGMHGLAAPVMSPAGTNFLLPDMEGLQLSGDIRHRGDRSPVAGQQVLLSMAGSEPEIQMTRTDKEGKFVFQLNGLKGPKDLIIQSPDAGEDILISTDPEFSLGAVPESVPFLIPDSATEQLYARMLLDRQIRQVYAQQDPDGTPPGALEHAPTLGRAFYGTPDHSILMDEFIRLPIMEEVLRELGKRVFLSREEGKLQVGILDLNSNRIIGPDPWFFLDGLPFRESELLLALDPAKIASIHLKSQKYFVGDLIMDGIIDIRSREGDAAMITFPRSVLRQYFQGLCTGESPVKIPEERNSEHIPHLPGTLLFVAHVDPGAATAVPFRLKAPDRTGNYELILQGRDEEGERVFRRYDFKVGPGTSGLN
jgi:hypothetical protein